MVLLCGLPLQVQFGVGRRWPMLVGVQAGLFVGTIVLCGLVLPYPGQTRHNVGVRDVLIAELAADGLVMHDARIDPATVIHLGDPKPSTRTLRRALASEGIRLGGAAFCGTVAGPFGGSVRIGPYSLQSGTIGRREWEESAEDPYATHDQLAGPFAGGAPDSPGVLLDFDAGVLHVLHRDRKAALVQRFVLAEHLPDLDQFRMATTADQAGRLWLFGRDRADGSMRALQFDPAALVGGFSEAIVTTRAFSDLHAARAVAVDANHPDACVLIEDVTGNVLALDLETGQHELLLDGSGTPELLECDHLGLSSSSELEPGERLREQNLQASNAAIRLWPDMMDRDPDHLTVWLNWAVFGDRTLKAHAMRGRR